jgi:hypothetical protein
MDVLRNFVQTAQALQSELNASCGPPDEGFRAAGQSVIPRALTRNTRGYIEKVANQANGSYDNGWYDACAVMIRRLLETLIIESFESHGLSDKIKTGQGDFLYLRDLIDKTLAEPSWNLGRNVKTALPRLKDIGDKSAHSRRFNAVRHDIDNIISEVRLVVQELVYLSGLR